MSVVVSVWGSNQSGRPIIEATAARHGGQAESKIAATFSLLIHSFFVLKLAARSLVDGDHGASGLGSDLAFDLRSMGFRPPVDGSTSGHGHGRGSKRSWVHLGGSIRRCEHESLIFRQADSSIFVKSL